MNPSLPGADNPLPLHNLLYADRQPLQRQMQAVQARLSRGEPVDRLQARIDERVQRSLSTVAQRQALQLDTQLQPLPVADEADRIEALLREHQVVVVAGETGSGKTTQLPKICLRAGRGIHGRIGHTQPRRVAARSVAQRLAQETGAKLGEAIGFQVRFSDQSQDCSRIKLMTDGILLAEIQRDPQLLDYDTLILDEAHERSLNIDFLLGFLKQLLPKRPELRLIVTSATIDEAGFADFFDGAPIVRVGGRAWPVEIRYQPAEGDRGEQAERVREAVHQCLAEAPPAADARDILVFLSGEREIRETAQLLRQQDDLDVLPLYARLSAADQDRVFRQRGRRRVILATNVAETSLTVPGVGFVIDPGDARISRYQARTGIQRLPIEAISQASANQRAGRAGRIAPGVCIRLYSEEDFVGRPEYTDPEIRRTNLSAVILRMAALKLGDIRDFPFLEPPDTRQVNAGVRDLQELKLLDGQGSVTADGKRLALLPVDPRFAVMLQDASRRGCLAELLVIVSALSVQDPRERPADKRQHADQVHRQWYHEKSDFLGWLNLWNSWQQQRQELSRRQFREWCRKNFLSLQRLHEWWDVHRQLRLTAREQGWKENQKSAAYKEVHESLLNGLLMQVGFRRDRAEYLGTGNRTFQIFPGSSQYKQRPKWVVAGEFLETSRLFALQVAEIEPDWLLPLADHLIQREYLEPLYSNRRGEVTAREKCSLSGLVLGEDKRVSYKSIDPAACRDIFIREALVAGRYGDRAKFMQHNRRLVEEIEDFQKRLRRTDLMPDEEERAALFEQILPSDIVDRASFEHWRRAEEKHNPQVLFYDAEQWRRRARFELQDQYPDQLHWQGVSYPLKYEFDPRGEADGVTLVLSLEQLNGFPRWLPDWLVPGLRLEKAEALMRSLPKQWRRQLQPVNSRAMDFVNQVQPDNQPMVSALANWIRSSLGLQVEENAFEPARLDSWYKMNIRLLDGEGRQLAQSRDPDELLATYRQQAGEAIREVRSEALDEQAISEFPQQGISAWADIRREGGSVRVWTGLEDRNGEVWLRYFEHPREAQQASGNGLARLYLLGCRQAEKYLRKELFKHNELELVPLPRGKRDTWVDALLLAAVSDLANTRLNEVPDSDTFERELKQVQSGLIPHAIELETRLVQVARAWREVSAALAELDPAMQSVAEDMREQAARLLDPDSYRAMPADWRPELGRYLEAMQKRLQRLSSKGLQPDLDAQQLFSLQWQRLQRLEAFAADDDESDWPELTDFRWMLEEFRVSLFAQPMKTRRPVSQKRLDTLVEKVEIAEKRAMVRSPIARPYGKLSP